MHLAPHLPIPSRRPFDMRVPALVTQRAKKLQRFCYIHPPPPILNTHTGTKRRTHTQSEHTGTQMHIREGKWAPGQLHIVVHMLYAHAIQTPFSQQKHGHFVFSSQSVHYSFAFSLTLLLSFLLITVQLPMASISPNTATQLAAPIMSYTSLPLEEW